MSIHEEQLVDAFSDSVGREKAERVIEDVRERADIGNGEALAEEEAIEVAVEVANHDDATPFVRTAANTLQTRIRTGNI